MFLTSMSFNPGGGAGSSRKLPYYKRLPMSVSCDVPLVVFTNDGPVNTKMPDLCHDRFEKFFGKLTIGDLVQPGPVCQGKLGSGFVICSNHRPEASIKDIE